MKAFGISAADRPLTSMLVYPVAGSSVYLPLRSVGGPSAVASLVARARPVSLGLAVTVGVQDGETAQHWQYGKAAQYWKQSSTTSFHERQPDSAQRAR